MNSNQLIDEKPSCKKCKYAILQDEGYSNYTVMGTEFHCAKKLHPEDGFDYWYGEDKRLDYAQQCSSFEQGEPIKMDVEQNDVADLTPEQLKIWEKHKS